MDDEAAARREAEIKEQADRLFDIFWREFNSEVENREAGLDPEDVFQLWVVDKLAKIYAFCTDETAELRTRIEYLEEGRVAPRS